MLQIRIKMNTNLQQSSWILPVTDFLNLLVFGHIRKPWNMYLFVLSNKGPTI